MALREQKWGQTPCGHVYVPGTWHCTGTHPNQLSVGSVASLESRAREAELGLGAPCLCFSRKKRSASRSEPPLQG